MILFLPNITLNVILENLSSISLAATAGTKILLSGFLKSDEATIINALQLNNLTYFSTEQKGEWLAIAAQYNQR